MNRERRWYRLIRLGLVGGTIGSLAVLWFVTIRQIALMTPDATDCGCAVAPIAWPWPVAFGTALVAVVATLLTGRLFVASWIRIRRHTRLAATMMVNGRRLVHQSSAIAYTLVPSPIDQAMTVGLWRPQIVVTTGLVHRLTGSEFASVLRHEQAHARGHDPLWSLLLEAVGETLGWVGNLRQLVNSAFSLREVLADEVATKNYTRVAGLSGAIVKLATTEGPHVVPAFSPNNDRVNKLLDQTWQLPLPRLTWRTTVVGLALALGIFAAGRLPAATAAAQPTLPAEACWLRKAICSGAPAQILIMSPNGTMSHYGW